VSVEQAADRADAAAVDHYFTFLLKTLFLVSCGHRKQTDDCLIMHPWSPVGSAIQIPQFAVIVTDCWFVTEGER